MSESLGVAWVEFKRKDEAYSLESSRNFSPGFSNYCENVMILMGIKLKDVRMVVGAVYHFYAFCKHQIVSTE